MKHIECIRSDLGRRENSRIDGFLTAIDESGYEGDQNKLRAMIAEGRNIYSLILRWLILRGSGSEDLLGSRTIYRDREV